MVPSPLPPPPAQTCNPSPVADEACKTTDQSPRVLSSGPSPLSTTLSSDNDQGGTLNAITLSRNMAAYAVRRSSSSRAEEELPVDASDVATIRASSPPSSSSRPSSQAPRTTPRIPVIHPPISSQTAHQHTQVRGALDSALIIQQIQHRVFDPSRLFEFLGSLVKFHCAPMRDGAVDEMIAIARTSFVVRRSGLGEQKEVNMEMAVLAIRKCFELFELMKLVRYSLRWVGSTLFQGRRESQHNCYLLGHCQPSTAVPSEVSLPNFDGLRAVRPSRSSSQRSHLV